MSFVSFVVFFCSIPMGLFSAASVRHDFSFTSASTARTFKVQKLGVGWDLDDAVKLTEVG